MPKIKELQANHRIAKYGYNQLRITCFNKDPEVRFNLLRTRIDNNNFYCAFCGHPLYEEK